MTPENPANVMILGSGGREDALAWKLQQSPRVGHVYVAPGNGGTERLPDTSRVGLDPMNGTEVATAAGDYEIGLVVIGPDALLVYGVADVLRTNNILTFGPGRDGAALEGSKSKAIRFMERYGIPHPETVVFDDMADAMEFFKRPSWQVENPGYVVKADGLAAGKGVFVCDTRKEAEYAVEQIMGTRIFGVAGSKVLIQEKLVGFEVSVMAIISNGVFKTLPSSEDHKQIHDGDHGPNTGGMGVVAPHQLVTPALAHQIEKEILRPSVQGLLGDRIDYRGVLYPGVMVTPTGPKVLEYNCRFGDPETQAVLPLLEVDVYTLLHNAARGEAICTGEIPVKSGSCVVVTLASAGYPGEYKKGKIIQGLDKVTSGSDVTIFHAGTELVGEQYQTAGGRVLMIAGTGASAETARRSAYGAIGDDSIIFDGMQYRRDIGVRQRAQI